MAKDNSVIKRADEAYKRCEFAEALKLYQELLGLAKTKATRASVYYKLYLCCEKLSKFKEAVEYLDELLRLDPEHEARNQREILIRKAELIKNVLQVKIGIKKVRKKEKEEIDQLEVFVKARKKSDRLRQQGFTLERKAQRCRSDKPIKARALYLKAASKFRAAAEEMVPLEHRERGVEVEKYWAVFEASDRFIFCFECYIKMLQMAKAWELLGRVYEAKNKEKAGDMFMCAAEDKTYLAEVKKTFKGKDDNKDTALLLFRQGCWERAEELYDQGIGVERKIEFGDEIEQKLTEAREKKERAERRLKEIDSHRKKQRGKKRKKKNLVKVAKTGKKISDEKIEEEAAAS